MTFCSFKSANLLFDIVNIFYGFPPLMDAT